MNRPTLENYIKDRTGMEVYQFATAIGSSRSTLAKWWNSNRALLGYVTTGYRVSVQCKKP